MTTSGTDGTGDAGEDRPWWQDAVMAQVYPRSFADSDGDGVGDLEGIRRHLDHLVWLGVDGLWLSPVYRSPMADFGYDVSDHCDVDPLFGDLAALDRLVGEAHRRGLKVMLDWVPNHTSDQHPWFVASRSSRDDPKRDWYVWRDGKGGSGPDAEPPNNWGAAFGGRAWAFDEGTGQWYLHLFLPEQPDLNWANPEVVEAMHDVLRFWLDRGVDGFRADVVHLIGKDESLADLPPEHAAVPVVVHDHPSTHELLRGIRRVLDAYPGDRAMVGEIVLGNARLLAPYYGRGDELHMVFNFTLLWAPWDAGRWARAISEAEEAFAPGGAWPTWALSNHDTPRHRARYGGSEERARVAAVVLATLRGTPFLYAGEELGLEDAAVPEERRVDPGGRDGCRAPIPWGPEPGHGWAGEPWLPWPPEPEARNVARLAEDADSILWLYRRLLAARRASPALRAGAWRLLESPPDVLAYRRDHGGDARLVVANFADHPRTVARPGRWAVEVATHRAREGGAWDGTLGPTDALVLRPA